MPLSGQSCMRRSVHRSPRSLWSMLAKAKSDKFQVLLKSTVEGVGKANQVVQVNSGYFNNFLRPKGLASVISDEEVKIKEANEREALAKLKQDAINCATEIQSIAVITMKRKLGENGKIFGTVTHKQIVEEIKLKSGGKVDLSTKNKMDFPEIHGLGEYGVTIHLHPEVTATLKLKVVKE
uniref:50S ribosomal protein L9, chloroplastic n=1 Tax=Cryptomonas curvata TaxID=233186 RepID=A0A7S0MS90_9CRYP